MSSSLGSLVARARHPTYSRQAVSSVVRISSEGDPLTHMERDISILTSSSHPVRPHGRDSSQRREERQETRADSYELFLFELLDPTEGICSEPSAIERIALLDFEYLSSAQEADSGRRRSATRWEISEEVGIGKCSIGTWEQLKAELKAQFLPVSDRLVDFKYLGARSRTGGKGPRQARGPERCRNVEEEVRQAHQRGKTTESSPP
ncbi:hypothetical protein V6N11_014195 [Hibiscus sabdariffa]|uniref:Uncharacterized protein n=1 Tax=Hibiscus sabdariffa TaxID=183260 RepID=A0ABR2AFZ9_9ROSI